ncbi:MAG: Septum formation protein Maf [Candidatus Anoxychlamydiales bacterium]|nr:Septum formation protein Maf [Candidatus Anoxychlamydiales bacterium]
MLILASSSPRRRKILSYFSIKFKCIPSHFDEKKIKFIKDPKSYAIEIAENKAKALNEKYYNDIILSADTICFANNKVYTKPKNENDAFRILNELSNTWHSVFTAISIKHKDTIFSDIEETKILFHALTDEQIKKYHLSFYYQDKAAGYAIQKAGSIIIKNMIGCYYNVMGMPINILSKSLLKVGIDLWDFLKPS